MIFRLSIVFVLSVFTIAPARVFAVEQINEGQLSRDQRLSNAVAETGLTLDDAARTLLTQKCQTAQQQLIKIQDNTDKLIGLRIETYSSFQRELQAIKLRMARQGVDASEIDLLIGKLQQSLDTLTLKADTYGTTLDDVITVDCMQKPEQFKAGLILLRAQRTEVFKSANSLRTIMEDAQQNTFTQLKKRLTA